jgi:signal transduction histidine kinase
MESPVRAHRRVLEPSLSEGPLRWWVALACGATVALTMSTQLLFQPFVWRGFDGDEILSGWLDLLVQRLAVALPIAGTVALASRAPARTPPVRAMLFAVAIAASAITGELALVAWGSLAAPPDARSLIVRATQWFILATSVAGLYYLWRRGVAARAATQAAEMRRIRLERQVVQARLQTLRSQIEPHFLFNTLATLRRLHETEPNRGAQLLAHFLEYLRTTLPQRHAGPGTLRQEVDLARAYLGMVKVRMGDRLSFDLDVPAELLDTEFPALTIATLVENAVKHGVGPSPQGGRIEVRARRLDAAHLEVTVSDTGVGFSGSGGSGIGLANVRARLGTLYGAGASLSLGANVPTGVRASMRLPATSVAS